MYRYLFDYLWFFYGFSVLVSYPTHETGMLKEIDSLEKQYVMEKMGELTLRSCSIQSRKPVRSIGHTLDLQVPLTMYRTSYPDKQATRTW